MLIDKYISRILVFYLIIDALTGFLLRIGGPSISLFFNMTLLLVMLFRIIQISKPRFLFILAIFFILFFSTLIFIPNNLSEFGRGFTWILKILLFPISFYYFLSVFELYPDLYNNKRFQQIIGFNFLIILFNLLIGALGFGFSAYDLDNTTVGFFMAGNELSSVYIYIGGIILTHLIQKKGINHFVFSIIFIAFSFLLGSKTALAGSLLLVLLFNLFKTLKLKVILFKVSILIIAIITIGNLYLYILEQQGILSRFQFFYEKQGSNLLTFLLSNRNNYAKYAIEIYSESGWLAQLFGLNFSNFIQKMAFYVGRPKTVEIDFFDLLLSYGIVGLVTILGFWIKNFLILTFSIPNKIGKNIFILNFLIFILSILSGHIFMSTRLCYFISLTTIFFYFQGKENVYFKQQEISEKNNQIVKETIK